MRTCSFAADQEGLLRVWLTEQYSGLSDISLIYKKRLNSIGIQTLLMIEHGPLLVDSTNNHLTALIGVRVV